MTTGDGNTGIIEEFRANEGKVVVSSRATR